MQLSIIIPTYNVESWIEKCLLSIVSQNIDDKSYEVIVVIDGSPDQSSAIARKLSETYPQIKVIDQANRGLSGARNTGIRNAIGKYLLFIDPDDYLEPDVLETMLAFAEKGKLEIAMFGQNMVVNGIRKPRGQYNPDETEVMSGIELFFKRTSDSACKYLILTDYLKKNELYFLENAVYLEDGEWSGRLFAKAEKAAYKGIYFYNYVLRGDSIVTSGIAFTEAALTGYMDAAKNLIKFQRNDTLNDIQKDFLNQTIAKFVLLPITLCATKNGIKKINHIKSTIKRAGFSKLDNRGVRGMRLKHINLYNKSIFLLYFHLILTNIFLSVKMKIKN